MLIINNKMLLHRIYILFFYISKQLLAEVSYMANHHNILEYILDSYLIV